MPRCAPDPPSLEPIEAGPAVEAAVVIVEGLVVSGGDAGRSEGAVALGSADVAG